MTIYRVLTGLADEMIDPAMPGPEVAGPLQNLNGWLQAALAQEPNDISIGTDLTKRGPITRWLGYAFGNPRILPSQAALLLPIQPGEPNPLFQIFDSIDKEPQSSVTFGNGPFEMTLAGPVQREMWLAVPYVIALVLTGGDATNYRGFFEIEDITKEVPATLPGSTFLDENEVEQPHTWETWLVDGANHTPIKIGNKWYKQTIRNLDGQPLDASAWVPLMLAGQVNVISESDFRKVQADNQPE